MNKIKDLFKGNKSKKKNLTNMSKKKVVSKPKKDVKKIVDIKEPSYKKSSRYRERIIIQR